MTIINHLKKKKNFEPGKNSMHVQNMQLKAAVITVATDPSMQNDNPTSNF